MLKTNNKPHAAKTLISLSVLAILSIATKSAKAQIVSFTCSQSLSFGDVIACPTGPSTITITPTGSRTVGGCLTAGNAPFNNAECKITQRGKPQSIQVSVSGAVKTLNAGTHTLTYNNFNLITNAGGATQTRKKRNITVPIGATLNVPASQPGGTYTGTFTLNAVIL